MNFNEEIFREYDIRGKYEIDYDDDFAFKLGQAFYLFCKKYNTDESSKELSLAIGYDARHSSVPLSTKLCEGFASMGGRVFNIGLVTSPVCYFACYHIPNLSGSIMVTGSHNPPEYNGFKISPTSGTLTGEKIQELKRLFKEITDQPESNKGEILDYDIKTPYYKRIGSEFQHLDDFTFVVDCGNGAAGSVSRFAYKACNLNPIMLFEEPDGDFPNHHPDPTLAENLKDLRKSIKENDALFGIGYDGDADRIVIVDYDGTSIDTDKLMSIYAKSVLEENPGATIVGDVKCSEEYFSLLRKWGANAIMWKTGHSLVKQKIKEEKAPFGGEFSGHIFFADRYFGYDDALYCSLRLIEILQKTKKSLKELLVDFPETFSTPEIRIEVGEKEKYEIVEKYKREIQKHALSINEIDGVRAQFETGWALVRVSNTQPAVTLRFEARSVKDLDKIKQISSGILGIL